MNRAAELGETLVWFYFFIFSPANCVLFVSRSVPMRRICFELQSSSRFLESSDRAWDALSDLLALTQWDRGGGGEQARENARGQKKHTDFPIKVLVMCTRARKICLHRTTNKALLLCRLRPYIYQPVPGVEQFLLINVPTENVHTVHCPESHTRSLTLQFLEAHCVKRGWLRDAQHPAGLSTDSPSLRTTAAISDLRCARNLWPSLSQTTASLTTPPLWLHTGSRGVKRYLRGE